MDERIDIVDKNGEPTGQTALKSEIHSKGFYHNTAHVWLYTATGDILLAQRAASKAICPLLWDVSVAGHVDAGETIIEAAIRETQEEIGLTLNESELHKIGVFPCFQSYDNSIVDNEFHHTFIAQLQTPISQLKPQQGEVEAIKLLRISECLKAMETSDYNNHFISSNRPYYEFVFHTILQLTS
ncbi:NUDIX hydrolase [Hanstruepera marina]|uniref:NUDIX hydrolase n=1 Tax=Hanstruepera marina TaxID=2873265 RepID=UPI001CA7B54F|nr:NUDIX domain-containing protein [Hanstruepera marina]